MNGFNKPTSSVTEQLPADSSGIINMSSPSGSSDSGLSGAETRQHTTLAVTRGKSMNLMAKVQNENTSISTDTLNVLSSKKMPSGEGRQKSNLFFQQFQAQMSQMKSAMDAVQNEILLHKTGRPPPPVVVEESRPPIRVGPGRPRGSGRGSRRGAASANANPSQAESVTYHSQISGSNGLKMKIRKSPSHGRRGGHKGGNRRGRLKKKKDDDEDEISDFEEDYQPKKSSEHKSPKVPGCEVSNLKPSGWGDAIPENLLQIIFSLIIKDEGCIPFLVRASKVCRLWWKVASKAELWTHVDLASGRVKDVYRSERNLVYLLENRFFHVKHLNIGGWSSALTHGAVEVLARTCKDIESLFMSSCHKLSATNLKTITESCSFLKKLDLSAISNTYNAKSALSTSSIGEVAETLGSRLVHISLANNCLASAPQLVSCLAEHCINLEVLDLSNIRSPRRDSIVIKMEQLQQGCPSMKILRLTNSEVVLGETALKDQAASPGFPMLEEVSIAVDPKLCPGMDDSDLARIVKNSNKLRLLDVRGCTKISDSGLVRVPAWDLEHLYLSGCYATKSSSDGLELVVRKWKHSFKEIDFSWTPSEDSINLAIKALVDTDDGQKPPLRILDLCGSSVSFDSVKVALRACLDLRILNLTSCRALPRGIKRHYQTAEEVATLREQVLNGKFDDHNNE